jgi:hypothetical protein
MIDTSPYPYVKAIMRIPVLACDSSDMRCSVDQRIDNLIGSPHNTHSHAWFHEDKKIPSSEKIKYKRVSI